MKSLKSCLLWLTIIGLTLSFAGLHFSFAAEIGKGVDFYLLEDEDMSFQTARDLPLNDLKLKAAPWIASDNIERYDWSSHYMYLKQSVDIPNMKGAKYVNLRGKPFVVAANGKRCYMGALWSDLSSSMPPGSAAIVHVEGDRLQRFKIGSQMVMQQGEAAKDMRDNAELKETLKREGLFHDGLECKLDKAYMYTKIGADRKDDALTIVYTYTLRNLDQDALYVLDPQKFDQALFYKYGNGIIARNMDTRESIICTIHPSPEYQRDLSWYTRLEKGKSMTRTVETVPIKPGVQLKPGKYNFQFSFFGNEAGDNNQLLLKNNKIRAGSEEADGRLWIGEVRAELAQDIK
jgi:hypothetical protein